MSAIDNKFQSKNFKSWNNITFRTSLQNLNFIKFLIDGNLGGIPTFMYDEKDAPDH